MIWKRVTRIGKIASRLEDEYIDYPEGWKPNVGDIGKVQNGYLDTAYVRSIAMMHEPYLQTKRKSESEWNRLKSDIGLNGIREPLLLMVNDPRDIGRPEIQLEGHRRLLAADELGMPEVPVEVRYFGETHKQGKDLFRNSLL